VNIIVVILNFGVLQHPKHPFNTALVTSKQQNDLHLAPARLGPKTLLTMPESAVIINIPSPRHMIAISCTQKKIKIY